MIRIGVCDDVSFYAEQLATVIEKWARKRNVNIQIEKFQSGEEILGDIEDNGDFTITFLDIEMTGISGVETARKIREKNRHANIVFISQSESDYKQILELSPCYYVEKPICADKVFEILNRALEVCRYLHETFVFRYDRRTYHIALREVLYFSSEKRMIRILMENGNEYVFYEKLDKLEQRLSDYNIRFLRIHKSYLVNARQIEQFHATQILIRNEVCLPISRERRTEIGNFHMQLLSAT